MSEQTPTPAIKFLDRNPPALPEETVRRIASQQFGLEGAFKPLVSERDQNFRVTTEHGEQYVLKVSNVDEDPNVVDLQTQCLLHVERIDPSVPVPKILRTKAGDASTWVDGPEGTRHILRVLTYLRGTELSKVPLTPALLRDLGATIARLDFSLRGFHHPAARHELLWDMRQAPRLRPHTSHIADSETRERAEGVLDSFIADILPGLARLRAQVIHHDANGDNVVVDAQMPERVTGILDFGDMIHAATATEPAVTSADLLMNGDFIEPMCELIAGYDSVLPLDEDEIDVLYDLALARCAITAVITAWRGASTEGPGYLAAYGPASHAALETLLTIGRDRVRASLRAACRFPPYCPKPGESVAPEDVEMLVGRRQRLLGAKLELSYRRPVRVVRGKGPWLFGADGSRFLDAYNNVPQVGHAHPHVARAIARQAAALNTNTRYLFRSVMDYAERLVETMPAGLDACLFVNSGSEANDVAFRMAKVVTGNRGALVMENAYHGITDSIAELSPYDQSGEPLPAHVRTLQSPDPYRGPFKDGAADLAAKYAADADRAIADLAENGVRPAAFMIDSGFTSNGIPTVPEGYLALVADKARAAGGLVIADEVQVGFARSGTHFWGYGARGLRPDFVTLGKPIGNGFPLGAVITSRAILEHFGAETDFFSTFGGNPVACAAGIAVLDVIEREGLMENARITGNYLRENLRDLMSRRELIGDVRGIGTLIAVELVRDRRTIEPAVSETEGVLNHLRDNFVLVGREGPYGNVLKIRPPLPFRREHADILTDAMEKAVAAF